jgi:hypothetical protein
MRSSLKPHHIANEIHLKRTQHSGSFLVVEGSDDSRFLKRFVDPKQCQVVVAHGKDILIPAVRILESQKVHGVLGVTDADFDRLEGTAPSSTNIVSAECHDIEAMLIRSPALEAVLHEFASPDKLSRFENEIGADLRTRLIETASSLGYLRWHSIRNRLNLCFDGLRFSSFIDQQTLNSNPNALVDELRNKSQNWIIPPEQLLSAGWPTDRNHDIWQVCCGHDIVELLVLALRRAIGSQQNIKVEHVAASLRLAYSKQDFARSLLRASINQWEVSSGFRLLDQNLGL